MVFMNIACDVVGVFINIPCGVVRVFKKHILLDIFYPCVLWVHILIIPLSVWVLGTIGLLDSIHPSVCLSVSNTFVSRPHLTNSKFSVCMHLGMAECRIPFWGHCNLGF